MKHTFKEFGAVVLNGEVVEQEGIEKEYTFTLKMKGLKLFEQEYGKPLIKALMGIFKKVDIEKIQSLNEDSNINDLIAESDGMIDEKFIRALACASYVKIEGNEAFNNETTVEELKESFVYDQMLLDMNFMVKILQMAVSAVFEKNRKDNVQNTKRKN